MYQDIALTGWLFDDARAALSVLAEQWRSRLGDPWLSDLLQGARSAQSQRSLSRAIALNQAGRPVEAEREGQNARSGFQLAGNRAGQLRARLEIVYALNRSINGEKCLTEASGVELDLRRFGYTWELGQYLLDRGTCRKLVGDIEGAARDFAQALNITARSAFPVLRLRALGLNAGLQRMRGNAAAAWASDRAGLLTYWSGAYPALREHQFCSDLGFWAQQMKLWHFAAAVARESVAALESTHNRASEGVARYTLANTAAMAGLRPEAEAEYRRAIRLLDFVPEDAVAKETRFYCEMRLAVMLASRGEVRAASEKLLHLRAQLVPESSIALAFHKALGYVSFRGGQTGQALQEYNEALAWARRALSSMPQRSDRARWRNESADLYRGLARAQIATGATADAERTWYEYLAAAPAPSNRSLDAALSQLRRETLVWYVQHDDGIAIWVMDNRGVQFHWSDAPKAELDGIVSDFSGQCARPGSAPEAIHSNARRLYDWLIGPVENRIEAGRTILISPDGSLGSIPFAALADARGSYLGERFAIGRIAGTGLDGRRSSGLTADDRAFIAGAPAIGASADSFPPLPNALREMQTVSQHFLSSEVIAGSAVSGAGIRRGLAGARLFHFAGHAVANAGLGGLVLSSREGSPEILDAASLPPGSAPKCKLAVLSACDSGSGEFGDGGDPGDLVQGFFRAGVQSVVASRWDVDSRITAAFMDVFYDSLLTRHKSIPEALRAAASAIRRNPQTWHAYYWAAFESFSADIP